MPDPAQPSGAPESGVVRRTSTRLEQWGMGVNLIKVTSRNYEWDREVSEILAVRRARSPSRVVVDEVDKGRLIPGALFPRGSGNVPPSGQGWIYGGWGRTWETEFDDGRTRFHDFVETQGLFRVWSRNTNICGMD